MQIILQDTGDYAVSFKYRPVLVNFMNQIKGRNFDARNRAWIIPSDAGQQLKQIADHISSNFERVEWLDGRTKTQPTDEFYIPPMPELTIEHGLKYEPKPYQAQGIARGLELKRFMNADDPGLGKSETLDSLIASPTGWIRMGDIKVGDRIFDKSGNEQFVEAIFPQGIVPTYRVTFSDDSTVDCNLDHLWSVRDQNRRRRGNGWTVKTTKEIIDLGITHKSNPNREESGRKPQLKWEIPVCDPVKYPKKDFLIKPYTLGALIGDGALSTGKIELSLPVEKYGIIERIGYELNDELTVSSAFYANIAHYRIVNKFDKFHHSNIYQKEIKRLSLNTTSLFKFIPEEYLRGDINQRLDLLAGLMDTDGSCVKNRTTFHTTSPQLTVDIKELVESLGGIVIIRPYDRTSEGKGIEYQVNIRTNFNPFYLQSKAEKWSKNKTFVVTRYIKSIEYIGKEEQQCIRVSSPDHLYLTNNFIVTHNTFQTIGTLDIAERLYGNVFPCLVVCPGSVKYHWQREWSKFTDRKAMVLTDDLLTSWPYYAKNGSYDVFIVNYESLRKYFVRAITTPRGKPMLFQHIVFKDTIDLFRSVIIDESHKCSDFGSQQTKFTIGIANGIAARKEWKITITGTPIINNHVGLLPQLCIMGRVEDFGGDRFYRQYFCSGPNKASNGRELRAKLWQTCFFRRTKAEVKKDMPPMERQIITCDITNRREYDMAQADLISYLKKYKSETDSKKQKSMRGIAFQKMNVLAQIAAKGKIKAIVEHIKDFQSSGKKLLVYCMLHEVVDELVRKFPHAVCITGRQDAIEKQRSIDLFSRNPKVTLCIISWAGGTGTDGLQNQCSDIDLIEYPWHDAGCSQIESRLDRTGQSEPVTARYWQGMNTVDEKKWEIIQIKKKISDAVMSNGEIEDNGDNIVDMVANMFNDEIGE